MPALSHRVLALAAVLWALPWAPASPGAAHAAPGEQSLSLQPGFATFADDDTRAYGGSLGLDYEYRISDAVGFRASGAGAYGEGGGSAYAGIATLGLVYNLDIIKYVPYLSGGVGAAATAGDSIDDDVNILVEVGGGVDVLHSRSFSYGAFVRFSTLLQDVDILQAGLRFTYRWGFF